VRGMRMTHQDSSSIETLSGNSTSLSIN